MLKLEIIQNSEPTATGYKYDIYLGQERIVTSKYPTYAALRELDRRGYTGPAEFWFNGKPSMRFKSIRAGARTTIKENEKTGPKIVKYTLDTFQHQKAA